MVIDKEKDFNSVKSKYISNALRMFPPDILTVENETINVNIAKKMQPELERNFQQWKRNGELGGIKTILTQLNK